MRPGIHPCTPNSPPMGLLVNVSLKNLLRGHFLCAAAEQAQRSTSPLPEQLLCQPDGKSWGGGGSVHAAVLWGAAGRRAGQGRGVSRSPPAGGSCTHAHFHMVRAAVILLVQQLKVVPPRGHEPGEEESGLACCTPGAPEKRRAPGPAAAISRVYASPRPHTQTRTCSQSLTVWAWTPGS